MVYSNLEAIAGAAHILGSPQLESPILFRAGLNQPECL